MCKHALTQTHSVHAEHDARKVQLTNDTRRLDAEANIHKLDGHITNVEVWEEVM